MKHRAVLFDLDGTLLDSLQDLGESMNQALAELGFAGHPLSAYRGYIGDGIAELARRALPAGEREPAVIDRCVASMRRIYTRRWDRTTRPYPGIPELLDTLRSRGIEVAVLSNKPHELTTLMVAGLLAPWRFFAVLGARPQVARKPDPQAALQIARAMDIPAEHFAYVGDTGTDMRTARAAGMFAVGALWGLRDEEELRSSGAAALARTPAEVPLLLE